MVPLASCPDVTQWRALLIGRFPDAEAEALEEHLARCSSCLETVRQVQVADTLLEGLSHAGSPPLVVPLDADAVSLIEELKSMRRRVTETAATSDTDSSAGADGELDTSFLAPPQAPDELGRLGPYRILEVVGYGGMGVVFKAEDTKLQRVVALKAMKPRVAATANAGKRFLREARTMAAVKHDHIATIYQVDEERGVPYLAMEFLAGEPLSERLQREGKLPIPEVLRIGREIAEGLAAAHTHGLIHRDIKPANIWLEQSSEPGVSAPGGARVKILDFGLARAESAGETLVTQAGAVVGTPAYMSPEQAHGEKVDARTDLWSLGVILYEMLTGTRPFRGSSTMAVLTSIAVDDPLPPASVNPNLPPELSDLVLRLLEKDPAQRPDSAQAVIQTLAKLSSGVPQTLPATQPAPRKPRRPFWLAVATALLLVVGPLAYFFGGTIIRIATNQGELVVEVDDKDIEIRIVQDGVVVQDKTARREFTLTAGKGQIEVFEKDGIRLATRQFELTRGGKTTVRVTLNELAAARQSAGEPKSEPRALATADPDRRAAEYALSIGGVIRINGREQDIGTAVLPNGPFRLTFVNLYENPQVTDTGLAHFKDCKNLTYLNLGVTGVTDAGLAYFEDCKNLTQLRLDATGVTDAGLAHFKDCKNLTVLHPGGAQVSDAGLAHFKDCKNLTHLGLADTRVTDAGLAYFKDCKNLTYVYLGGTQVTGAGLAYFKDCKNLTGLYLEGTRVSDAGLDVLVGLPRLNELGLGNTRISLYGYEQLKAAMPACKIAWSEPNRVAAEQVLALGGTVQVAAPAKEAQPVKAGEALPREFFQLRQIVLRNVQQPLGDLPATLAQLSFAEFDRLEAVDLSGTPLSDLPDLGFLAPIHGLREVALAKTGIGDQHLAVLPKLKRLVLDGNAIRGPGLESLAKQAELAELSLAGVGLADEDLARLPKLPNLRKLVLDGNPIRGPGLVGLHDQPELIELSLVGCPTSDLGASNLAGLKKLQRLSLVGAKLSDAGLRHLEGLTNLKELNLTGTNATAAGIAALQKALPQCKIEIDRETFDPIAPALSR